MSLENFIPEVWAARLLHNLRKAQVFGQTGVINRDYEGDIRSAGDTVRIGAIGSVTVSDYAKNSDLSGPQALSDAQTTLLINRAKYFNFSLDDVDRIQQSPKLMDSAMAEAAYALVDEADQYLAGLYTDAASSNWLGSEGSPIVPTATTMYENLVNMGVVLDEASAPRHSRFAIVPPFCYGLLLKDDRFVHSGTAAGDAVLRNGEVGQAAGFSIFVSNNVANTSGAKYKVLAGVPQAWTYAEQVLRIETYRPPLRFADAVKGLHLYGAKVLRPNCLAVMVASKS